MPEACPNLRWYNNGEPTPCPLEELGSCVVKTEAGDLVAPSHYDTDLGWVRSLDTEPIDGVHRFAPYRFHLRPTQGPAPSSAEPAADERGG
jgi:hypothetical protein